MPGKQPTVYRHGQQWYCQFYIDGRRCQKPCGKIGGVTEEEARTIAQGLIETARAQIARAKDARQKQNPIAQYDKRLSRRTDSHQSNCARYQQRLNDYFGDRNIEAITRHDVECWRDWLMTQAPRNDGRPGNLRNKSVKEHICWLAAIYNESGLPNPCRGVELPTRSEAERQEALEFFSPSEMQTMFTVCREQVAHFYNGFAFLAYTGCRVAEMQSIHRDYDIDEVNRVAWVTGKGGKRRPLKLTGPVAPAWAAIVDQMKTRPQMDGYIFPQYQTWARKGMDRLTLLAFGECAGQPVRHGHPHMLRHTLASLALLHFKPPWNIAFLAKWLGHVDISTTYKIYGHWIAQEPPSSFDYKMTTEIENAS